LIWTLNHNPLNLPNSEGNALQVPSLPENHRVLSSPLRSTGRLQSFTAETDLRSLDTRFPPHRHPPPTITGLPHINRGRALSAILPSSTDPPPSTSIPPSTSSSPSGSSSTTRTKIIAGVVTPATVIIILGLIIFCMLRRKHRNSAARPVSFRPFLDYPTRRSNSTAKGIIASRTRSSFTRRNQADIEQCVDPVREIVPAQGNLSNSVNESQRLRDTPDRLHALTGRFESETHQIGVLAQLGQPSAENHLVLEEMRHTTNLVIPCGSSHDITARSPSVGSSPPPSYCLHS
jgi:hypothetical protein